MPISRGYAPRRPPPLHSLHQGAAWSVLSFEIRFQSPRKRSVTLRAELDAVPSLHDCPGVGPGALPGGVDLAQNAPPAPRSSRRQRPQTTASYCLSHPFPPSLALSLSPLPCFLVAKQFESTDIPPQHSSCRASSQVAVGQASQAGQVSCVVVGEERGVAYGTCGCHRF
jgi:hypothetical protein